jgi:hypothetical protein
MAGLAEEAGETFGKSTKNWPLSRGLWQRTAAIMIFRSLDKRVSQIFDRLVELSRFALVSFGVVLMLDSRQTNVNGCSKLPRNAGRSSRSSPPASQTYCAVEGPLVCTYAALYVSARRSK